MQIPVDKFKLQRIVAAYKLRLAVKAADLGARPETWGQGRIISAANERKHLSDEDKYRIAPYPYPGLRSFDQDEGELFYGRERNVEALRTILAQRRVVVVLGGSGSGKSSLVRAGLLPFLNTERRIEGRDGNWYAVEFRPRTDPLGELATALVRQLLQPLLKLGRDDLLQALGLPSDADCENEGTINILHEQMHRRFLEAKRAGRAQVLKSLLEIVDQHLEVCDRIVTQGRRLAEPNLILLVDQLEEVFRPEIVDSEREALLNLIVDLHEHMQKTSRRGGLFLAATIRSEEVHRCAEHRGLSEVVIGSGYQIELLDVDNPEDARDLRRAIIQPARNVFEDWGLGEQLQHDEAPFEKGVPDLLLKGAARLSAELDHRPDQLPLLQHALQAIWHAAMRRWSDPQSIVDKLEISRVDLPGQTGPWEAPDLGACLKVRVDKAAERAAERFAEVTGTSQSVGREALRGAFRALARRDDKGNWARRFAGRDEMTAFLKADPASVVARLSDDKRWQALEDALHVFQLRGYLSKGGDGKFDISHEALIRNWPLFQDWLRAPEEVAYALSRMLVEVEPEKFEQASARDKMRLIPEDLAARVAAVSEGGELPERWGQDQIAPYLLRPGLRRRWGGEKREALRHVTRLAGLAEEAREQAAEQARAELQRDADTRALREARAKSAWVFGSFLLLFAAIAATYLYRNAQIATGLAETAVANFYAGGLLRESTPTEGLREFQAIHARRVLLGGAKSADKAVLHETGWRSWDLGVRAILGRAHVNRMEKPPSESNAPSCIALGDPSNSEQESARVLLVGAADTEVRLLPPANGTSQLRFETRKEGGDWLAVAHDGTLDAIKEGRLCLSSDGSALTVSSRGAPLPYIVELYWFFSCHGEANCNDNSWRVFLRSVPVVPPIGGVGTAASFSCVRSIRIVPISKQLPDISRIEIDFTSEIFDECGKGGGISNLRFLRANYLMGVATAMPAREPPKERPSFKECTGDANANNLVCDIGLPGDLKPMLYLFRDAFPGVWSVAVFPFHQQFAVQNIFVFAPSIARAAVDKQGNIWLTDNSGLYWKIVNDHTALISELSRRAEALTKKDGWQLTLPPEILMTLRESDLRSPVPR